MASHSGRKPFICSFCSLSFSRLDNLKTHIKTHNKERPVSAEAQCAVRTQLELTKVLQLQPYPPAPPSELQLLVTAGGAHNISFVPGQDQEISLISADPPHSRLTLLSQGSGQNATEVPRGGGAEISLLETQMSPPTEPMHVITLSKEAMEQLQAHQAPPRTPQPPVQQLTTATPAPPDLHGHALQISSQPISISQTSQQISSHHIQGQTFQIQAGTVSYLYTTGLSHD